MVFGSHKPVSLLWMFMSTPKKAGSSAYDETEVMHHTVPEEFKPALFENGKQIPFPKPSKVRDKWMAESTSRMDMWKKQ